MNTELKLKGDRDILRVPSTKDKALRINLNAYIYGTFSEIGAGQETVRHFFRAGRSSGTVAKAMSAYDKDFSDAIYGAEPDGRYVTEQRLKKMLIHEVDLVEKRLSRSKHPDKVFFSFANTVATIDYTKTFKGHGWVGLKFQVEAIEAYNEIILHLRFKENDIHLQQETLGVLGVNLIYGSYYECNDPKKLLLSLYDNLNKDQLEIDTINFSGPVFAHVDNRLMSLQLVKNGMTDAVVFGPDGNNILPSEILYRKNILALRGSYRPVTKVNMDIYEKSYQKFIREENVCADKTVVLFEITLSNLRSSGEINERDFMDRARLLCSLGQTVMISNFQEYYKLVEYFSTYTKARVGLAMGVSNLIDIFDEKYYQHLSGGILEAFGKLFYRDLKVLLYPMIDTDGKILCSHNLKVDANMKLLYKFFKFNGKVIDIEDYDSEVLNIFSRDVLEMIRRDIAGWEEMLPLGVAEIIKRNKLFGYGENNYSGESS